MQLDAAEAGGLDFGDLVGRAGVLRMHGAEAEHVRVARLHLGGEAVDGLLLSGFGGDMQHDGAVHAPSGHGVERAALGAVGVVGAVIGDVRETRQRLCGERVGEDVGVKVDEHGVSPYKSGWFRES